MASTTAACTSPRKISYEDLDYGGFVYSQSKHDDIRRKVCMASTFSVAADDVTRDMQKQLMELEIRERESINLRLSRLEAKIVELENQVLVGHVKLCEAHDDIARLSKELNEEKSMRTLLQQCLDASVKDGTKASVPSANTARTPPTVLHLPPELPQTRQRNAPNFEDLEEMADLVQEMLRVYESRINTGTNVNGGAKVSPKSTLNGELIQNETPSAINYRDGATKNPVLQVDRLNVNDDDDEDDEIQEPLPPRATYALHNPKSFSFDDFDCDENTPSTDINTVSNKISTRQLVKAKKAHKSPKFKLKRRYLNFFTNGKIHRSLVSPLLNLGPTQHALMLRQLRYVKAVMHDLPWAKTRLRDMLTEYTQKKMTKEDMYPKLCHLSNEVQKTISNNNKNRTKLMESKSKSLVRITLAQEIVNGIAVIKHGRRGRPHETRLFYDHTLPNQLYWKSKNGEKSQEFLPLNSVKIELGHHTEVSKRAARKFNASEDCCLSLVASNRTLDLTLGDTMQRHWLLEALNKIIDYAKETVESNNNINRRLRRM